MTLLPKQLFIETTQSAILIRKSIVLSKLVDELLCIYRLRPLLFKTQEYDA